MGLPGVIHVKITTVFDEKTASVTRTLQYLGGWGLSILSAASLGDPESWDINNSILADTANLPDGTHTLRNEHVGPSYYDYAWTSIPNYEIDEDERETLL